MCARIVQTRTIDLSLTFSEERPDPQISSIAPPTPPGIVVGFTTWPGL